MIPAVILITGLISLIALLIATVLDHVEARRLAHRRRVLAQLVSVDVEALARRRHPSGLS